jgi:hypothetical protein
MYLIPKDYKKLIQTDNLTQVIAGDTTILADAENTAIEEASSYLRQKYELSQELTSTSMWDKSLVYQAANRVYLTANAYDAGTIYAAGAYVTFGTAPNTNVYRSIAGNAAHAFVPSEWTLIAPNYQIYYAKFPQPLFDLYAFYKVGDQVFYKGKVYTCAIDSTPQSFPPNIQDKYYELRPLPNIYPDDPKNGLVYWGAGVAYTVPATTEITNTTYWTVGDNRSQQLVTYIICITLYWVHMRIAPRNVPDLRVKNYDDAIKWFKNAAKGDDITANLPRIQPKIQGSRTRWGGNIKNQNTY